MATIEAPVSSRNRSRKGFLWISAIVLVLIAVLATLAGWFYRAARAALPQLDGAVQVAGLSDPVTVTRDPHGVPTIDASNLEDLFFAQGYVIAQDRLWQMDMTRRFAGGEMAEVLGSDWVKHDREQRILRLRERAQHAIEELTPRDRQYLEAYARGVNAFIAANNQHLAVEFRVLHYLPRTWTPADTLVIYANMVKELNHYSARVALEREKILAKLGPELTSDLYPNSSWRDRPPGDTAPLGRGAEGSFASPNLENSRTAATLTKAEFAMLLDSPSQLGSNNWVISGTHTASGKPLLSNDPHLGHQMPSLWYEVHLRSGSFDVVGVALPGTPTVILGHNQRIAWGFTNIGPTVQDVFVENFNASGQYQTPDEWREPEHRHEVIHVRGKRDLAFDVEVTRHGPIVTELFPGETRKIALQWTLYTPGALTLPFFDVNSAQDWDQFRRAFSAWVAPGQNVVYADVDGHIGYQATGRVPIRASGDGSLPASGADNAHEWVGYIPFEKLPSLFDPPSGILATANGRITPNNYPYSVSVEWEAPYRTQRIYKVLQSGKKFTPADMLALQTDIYSEFDQFCAQRFVYSLDHVKTLSSRAREARDLMRDWNGAMRADSAAAAIEVLSRREAYRLLLEPKLGPAPPGEDNTGALSWHTYSWFMWPVWMENLLLHQPARWLPSNYANYDQLLAAAVENVVGHSDAPRDVAAWRWGKLGEVEIDHPLFGSIPMLRRWAGPGRNEQSGNGYTVKAVGLDFGPSERTTVDLSDLDNSRLNIVTGQSGNLFSPYYMDQWNAWYHGTTFRLPFSGEAVNAARAHQLVLQPQK